jgi:glutaredoxin-like protein
MTWLSEEDKKESKEDFEKLEGRVKILNFTQSESQTCKETTELLAEVAELSGKLSLEVYDFVKNREIAEKYKIDKTPATVLLGENDKDYGIRFFGAPSGNELVSLDDAIINVSRGKTDLSAKAKAKIKTIDREVHIQVFVSPTCPFCPLVVMPAHKLAIESEYIRGDMIIAPEFPELRDKYSIVGLPKVVINEKIKFDGGLEEKFLEKVLEV